MLADVMHYVIKTLGPHFLSGVSPLKQRKIAEFARTREALHTVTIFLRGLNAVAAIYERVDYRPRH